MSKHFLHCPSMSCDFAKAVPQGSDLESFCPRCRTTLLSACPECRMPLKNMERGYCSWCGASTLRDVEAAPSVGTTSSEASGVGRPHRVQNR